MQRLVRTSTVVVIATSVLALVGCGEHDGVRGGEVEPLGSAAASLDTTLKDPNFADAFGWDQAIHYSTIQYPDINGDTLADACGRGAAGVWCSTDDGTGKLVNTSLWNDSFTNAAGFTLPQYYTTIQYANIDGDVNGRMDLCARGPSGIVCARSLAPGPGFSPAITWRPEFADASWNAPQYYSTIRFPDVNGDGKADLCARGAAGILCAPSTGAAFVNLSVWSPNFSDANGWTDPAYYTTIRFPDVNADGRADVCGRGSLGIWCALANTAGTAFNAPTLWQSSFSDASGWAATEFNSTIQYSDVNGDGKDDVCARGLAGIICALSSGTSFGPVTTWQGSFTDAGWLQPQYYSTIRIQKGVLCARGSAGLLCGFSNGSSAFTSWLALESRNESDLNGWTAPQYYKTINLTKDLKLMERGSAGIYSTPVFAPDKVSLASVGQVSTRRTALINKVWARSSVDTTQGIDGNDLLTGSDIVVSPLPAGVTVRRYRMNMPTAGGFPVTNGQAWVEGLADHFIPSASTNKLAIINPGHICEYRASPNQDSQAVIDLLNAGYAVLATYMPLITPRQCTGAHDSLFSLTGNLRPAGGLHPISYFLDPVRRSLNHALANFGYSKVLMSGLSGGGWTTTLYSALDTRITTSVAIAGGLPFYMRPQSDAEQEDYVQGGNDFFNFAAGGVTYKTGYKDLYVLGAYGAGRKQVQVFNRNDDCCFGQNQFKGAPSQWDSSVRNFEQEVRNQIQALGAGSFRAEINEADDPGFATHAFSRNTRLSAILAEFEGGNRPIGLGAGTMPFARTSNGHLMRHDGTAWTDTGLIVVGTPAIVTGAISGHSYDVFYRSPSNRLVHAFLNGGTWTVASDVTGLIVNDPVAQSWGNGRIDVFAMGKDLRPYHWRYDGSWSSAVQVTSAQGAGPMAMTASVNRLDLYFRGINDNLLHVSSSGGAPYTFENTGGVLRNFPAAAATSGTQWAYYVGSDDRLYEAQQFGAGAWTFTNVSSSAGQGSTKVLGSPSVHRDAATGNVKLYVRLASDQIGVFTKTGSTWTFSNPGGPARVNSPSASSLGVFVLDRSNQSMFRLDGAGWTSLGGFFER
jgi:hypothetical protein